MQKMSKCEDIFRASSFTNHYSNNIHYIHCFCKILQCKYFVFSSSVYSEVGILLIIKWHVAFEMQIMYKNLHNEFSTTFLQVMNHQTLHHITTNFGGLQTCLFLKFPININGYLMEHNTILSGRNLQEYHKNAMPSYLGFSSTLKIVETLNFSVTSVNSSVLYTEISVSMFLQKVR